MIDKSDREHLKRKTDEEEAEEEAIMTQEQEEAAYNQKIKDSLKIAFDAIGISAKATTDDLISLAENEEADVETGNATHRRKGLKLPAIYGSKQYEEHLYMGMVEINELEDDDVPPDLLGDDYNKPPEGFGDPFADDNDPFGTNDFNPPPVMSNDRLFSNGDAFGSNQFGNAPPPPPGGGAPPPPPPPGFGNQRAGNLPPPPPTPPPAAQRTSSEANIPAFMRDINRLKAERDAEANLVGDPSEAGSFIADPGQNMGYGRAPAPTGFPGMPPPPPGQQMMTMKGMNPNDSYDPMADESLFIGSNAIKNKYKNDQQKRGMFDDSMMGGKGLFDETMRDMSMSMDQDLNKNDISRLFGTMRGTATDNQNLKASSNVPPQMKGSGGLFDKIEEDEEEDKYEDNFGSKRPTNAGGLFDNIDSPEVRAPPKKTPTRGFLDDTMNDDDEDEGFNVKPTPQPPAQTKKGMFEETFDEGDSNESMIFGNKKPAPPPNPQNQAKPLPGLAPPTQKSTPFNYGNPPAEPPKKQQLFEDDYEEEESNIFPTKRPTVAGMFKDDDDPNQSILDTSRDKSFIEKARTTNSANHMMAMIMKGMDPKRQSIKKPEEKSIGDDDDEPEQFFKQEPKKESPPPAKAKAPMDYKPPQPEKKENKFFLDESRVESEADSVFDLPQKSKPTPPPPTGNKMLFMDDDEDEDESFIFDKPKSKPAPVAKPPVEAPPAKKKGFMFEEEESFDEFNLPPKAPVQEPPKPVVQEQKANPPPKEEPKPPKPEVQEVPIAKPTPPPVVEPEKKPEPEKKAEPVAEKKKAPQRGKIFEFL